MQQSPATAAFSKSLDREGSGSMASLHGVGPEEVAVNEGFHHSDDEAESDGVFTTVVPEVIREPATLAGGVDREIEDAHLQKDSEVYKILGDLPSSQQQFHLLLRVSQKHGIPVLMSDVRELMGDGDTEGARRASPVSVMQPKESIRRKKVSLLKLQTMRSSSNLTARKSSNNAMTIEELHRMLNSIRSEDASIEDRRLRVRALLDIIKERKHDVSSQVHDAFSTVLHTGSHSFSDLVHFLNHVPFWNDDIKLLSGKHGQHVGVYFSFVKWSLLTNLFIALLVCGFFVIPYEILYGFGGAESAVSNGGNITYTTGDTVAGLFTGGGALNASAYFLGSYVVPFSASALADYKGSAFVPEDASDPDMDLWNIPLAYLLTTMIYLSVILILIFHGFYTAVKNSYLYRSDRHGSEIASICFSECDYALSDPKALNITRLSRCQRLKEKLREEQMLIEYYESIPKYLGLRRVFTNLLVLAILGVSFYVIYVVVETYQNRGGLVNLLPAIVIALINAMIPTLLKHVATFERYRSPLTSIQITIARTCVLRFVGLYVFLFAIWTQFTGFQCWESYVGQRIYTQFVVGSIVVELFFNIFYDKWALWAYRKFGDKLLGVILLANEPPEFEVVEKALTLSYDQALVWVGSFFCPLLPLVGVLRAILMFYTEKWSTLWYCQPGTTVFAAKYGLKWLIWALMLATISFVALPLGYILTQVPSSGPHMDANWHDRFVDSLNSTSPCDVSELAVENCLVCLEPGFNASTVCWTGARFANTNGGSGISVTVTELCTACPKGCGPFRTLSAPYDAMVHEARSWPSWVLVALEYLDTPSFTLILSVFFICAYLLARAKAKGRLKWALKQERLRDSELWDKRWILDRLTQKFGAPRTGRTSKSSFATTKLA